MVCHDVILKFPPRSVCSVALPSGGDHDPPLPALTMPPRSRANRLARVTLALAVLALVTGTRPAAARTRRTAPSTSVAETSLADLRTALEQRRITSREIVQQYLARIAMDEDQLNAVIKLNPRALAWAGNVGTETSGSILSPSLQNFLVGIKPTVGRISRYGVIPITADQDTLGPMDTATRACTPPSGNDYTRFLDADRRQDILLSATSGIDAALAAHQLDALLFPGVNSANIGARPGYPSVTVPYALLPIAQGTGGLAYAFEQATKKREAPPLFP